MFLFCVVWSVGAAVVQNGAVADRDRFDKFVKGLAGLSLADGDTVPATQLPAKSLYEYCFDTNDLRWRSWKSLVQDYQVSSRAAEQGTETLDELGTESEK